MNIRKIYLFPLLVIIFVLSLSFPSGASGAIKYNPLVIQDLPGFETVCSQDSCDPIGAVSNIYNIAIGIGGILAVVMIIWAGMRYTLSGAVGGKEEAIKDIQYAVWGLVLLLGSFIILRTINPDLVNINLDFSNTPGITRPVGPVNPNVSTSTVCYIRTVATWSSLRSSSQEICFPYIGGDCGRTLTSAGGFGVTSNSAGIVAYSLCAFQGALNPQKECHPGLSAGSEICFPNIQLCRDSRYLFIPRSSAPLGDCSTKNE